MKNDVEKMMISYFCRDFEEFLLTGIEEEKEYFPFFTSCVDYLCELREKGIEATTYCISETMQNLIYNELKRYLGR